MDKQISFEQATARLEEIVSGLESRDIPLEESMKLFEEGTRLCAICDKELKNAEQKISDFEEMMKREINDD